jgi:threonine dehydratase
LEGHAVRTPLLEAEFLGRALGARLLIKAEPLQRTGSFKFRGAYNAISQLSPAALKAGVVGFSSGNHGQAVAAAARLCGAPAVIVMPKDAPAIKIGGTRRQGAEIVFYERGRDDREAIGARLAAERGLSLIRPYDDRQVIAGQGTIGLELVAQLGVAPDLVVVPAGGGGLIAGIGLALGAVAPTAKLYAAEPAGWHDHALSLSTGERRAAPEPSRATFCDSLLALEPGLLTFALNRRQMAGGLIVEDAEVARAMASAFRDLKLVIEPGGAVALAAVLSGKLDCRNKTVVVVASGGNVDASVYAKAMEAAPYG